MSGLAKWASKLLLVTCSVTGSTGDPHFEIIKKIHLSHPDHSKTPNCIHLLYIIHVDDTVLLFTCKSGKISRIHQILGVTCRCTGHLCSKLSSFRFWVLHKSCKSDIHLVITCILNSTSSHAIV